MFKDSLLDKFLGFGRKLIPKSVFEFFQPWYHGVLALSGAVIFGFPSRKLKVIGVTGTKGKSTTVYLISRFLEEAGYGVASIGSLGFRIAGEAGVKEWPNTLKMTMPGRWKIQKFLRQAVKAGCRFAVLEVTSEGIKQNRHLGIKFDAAVFTNLEKEHLEAHGSFEKYYREKQKLFRKTKNIHILNADSPYVYPVRGREGPQRASASNGVDLFSKFPARRVFYRIGDWDFKTNLEGEFNKLNILAAAAVAREYGVGDDVIQKALDKIKSVPGRMEFIEAGQPFKVVVDYAHTPGSLEAVYKTLKSKQLIVNGKRAKLICVLGAAGGGRDKWKRPVFGELAEKYCDRIILTNEDPYDEPPEKVVEDVLKGIKDGNKAEIIMSRRGAINMALNIAGKNDIVVITGKGSETSIAVEKGRKIPWSDKGVVEEILTGIKKQNG